MIRIYLVGFMGSGKTYTGSRLAKLLNIPFVDLDDVIEEQNQASIPSIFERLGESTFRAYERKALHSTAELGHCVISCGGGTPCFFDNMEWINQHGVSVYLKVDVDILWARLKKAKDYRPLLKEKTDEEIRAYIVNSLAARSKYYEQAYVVIKQEEEQIDIAQQLEQHLSQITGH